MKGVFQRRLDIYHQLRVAIRTHALIITRPGQKPSFSATAQLAFLYQADYDLVMSESTTSAPEILYADQDHNALRFVIPILLLIGFCLSFFIVQTFLNSMIPNVETRYFLACAAALPLGLLLTYAAEKVLKRTWRSGRKVALQADGLTLYQQEGEPVSLDRKKSVNLMLWNFPLSEYPRGGRERRVPGSWFCLAASLKQDDEQLIFHCFASPAEKERWREMYFFHLIDPAEVYDTSLLSRVTIPTRPEIPADVIAGKNGRYWLAERERWQYGIELTPPDFGKLLAHVHEYEIHY
jgi:hypothetical protein